VNSVASPRFRPGQIVHFNGLASTVSDVRIDEQGVLYLIITGDVHLPLWVPEEQLNVDREETQRPLGTCQLVVAGNLLGCLD
jgi:hypothetical protein